ncbi:hypothetical protein D3C85_1252730 [compost metagenome]
MSVMILSQEAPSRMPIITPRRSGPARAVVVKLVEVLPEFRPPPDTGIVAFSSPQTPRPARGSSAELVHSGYPALYAGASVLNTGSVSTCATRA